MKLSLIASVLMIFAILMLPMKSTALSMSQFVSICSTQKGDCNEHPLLTAYVGGALDLIAMLDEETDYLGEVYCKETAELFDVPVIINYMMAHSEAYADKNAMLLERRGDC